MKRLFRVVVEIRQFRFGPEYEIYVDGNLAGFVFFFFIGKYWIGALSGGKYADCQVTEQDLVTKSEDVAALIATRIEAQISKGKKLNVRA